MVNTSLDYCMSLDSMHFFPPSVSLTETATQATATKKVPEFEVTDCNDFSRASILKRFYRVLLHTKFV